MHLDTKQHPADRPIGLAVAHMREEGGDWIEGSPGAFGFFHTALFADGWAYDIKLTAFGNERGARRVPYMPVFQNGVPQPIVAQVKDFKAPEEKADASWQDAVLKRLDRLERRVQNIDTKQYFSR